MSPEGPIWLVLGLQTNIDHLINSRFSSRHTQIPIFHQLSKSIANPALAIPVRILSFILDWSRGNDFRDTRWADRVLKFCDQNHPRKSRRLSGIAVGYHVELEEPMCSRDMHDTCRSIGELDDQGGMAVLDIIQRLANEDGNVDFDWHSHREPRELEAAFTVGSWRGL